MNKYKTITLLIVIVAGVILPFIPSLVIIEMFFLLIPFLLIFAVTLILLILSLFGTALNKRKALFFFSIIPLFIASQLYSGFIVDYIQRLRSEQIILEIEKLKKESGSLPDNYNTTAGIEYIKMKDSEHFTIEYSRGFMVKEKYESENRKWRSYGWDD